MRKPKDLAILLLEIKKLKDDEIATRIQEFDQIFTDEHRLLVQKEAESILQDPTTCTLAGMKKPYCPQKAKLYASYIIYHIVNNGENYW